MISPLLRRTESGEAAGADTKARLAERQLVARRAWGFLGFGLMLMLVYFKPCFRLIRLALDSNLHSHILLVPAVSAYLVWIQRGRMFERLGCSARLAALGMVMGVAVEGLGLALAGRGMLSGANDMLAIHILALLCFLAAGMALFFGAAFLRAAAFPILFLLFAVPIPDRVMEALEVALQHGSAKAAELLFSVSGLPFFREGLIFEVPGLRLEVARECSGVRSSLVLFITSLLAGYLFLQSVWNRTILAFSVILIGIFRNGLRIVTLAWLTVNVDRGIIDGPLHHRGGPIFFLLSLFPLLLIIFLLRRSEGRGGKIQAGL